MGQEEYHTEKKERRDELIAKTLKHCQGV